MSKGSKRRPHQITELQLARRWASVFRDKVDMEEFLDLWGDELTCIAAETGADRELDFDGERFEEEYYNAFLEGRWNPPLTAY